MKLWVITRKSCITALLLLLIVILSVFVIKNAAISSVSGKKKDLPIYCVDKGDEKVASISFDAAWGNEDTEQLINILDKYNVKATFFVVGDWVDKYPESVKQLSDAGHEVMNHSNKHPHMPELSKDKMRDELTQCNNKIEAITGVKPILFRAPYGDYNNEVIQTVRECGSYTIQWDVDSLDWKDLSADEITKRVISKIKPGSIVLFHNAAKHTPEALPGILEKLKSDGYNIIPISQLIYADNYTINTEGRQHLNSNTASDSEKSQ